MTKKNIVVDLVPTSEDFSSMVDCVGYDNAVLVLTNLVVFLLSFPGAPTFIPSEVLQKVRDDGLEVKWRRREAKVPTTIIGGHKLLAGLEFAAGPLVVPVEELDREEDTPKNDIDNLTKH